MREDKLKILIVEDDNVIAEMYKIKLEQEGFLVIVAEDGKVGLDKARLEKPDLILLDIMLPQIDGFSVLSELRSDEKLKNTPVFLLTNLGTAEDIAKGKKLGATDYLVKANLTPNQVAETIKKFLE